MIWKNRSKTTSTLTSRKSISSFLIICLRMFRRGFMGEEKRRIMKITQHLIKTVLNHDQLCSKESFVFAYLQFIMYVKFDRVFDIPNCIKSINRLYKRSTTMQQNNKKFTKGKFTPHKERIVDASHQESFIFNKTPILASALKKLKAKSTTSSLPKPAKRSQPIEIQQTKPTKKVKRSLQQMVPTLSYTPLQRDLLNFFTINKTTLKNFTSVPEPKFEVGSTILTALCDRGIGGKFLVGNLFRNKKCYIDYKEVSLFSNEKKNQEVLEKYDSAGEFVVGTVVKGINPSHVQVSLSSFLNVDEKAIKVGQCFPAQIKSKEELGCLLIAFGIKGWKIFLAKASVEQEVFDELTEDKQVIVVVKEIQENKKILKVGLAAEEQISMNFKGLEQEDLAKMQLDQYVAPGTLLNTKVIKILQNGLMVKFLKAFVGFIHCDHLNRPLQSYTVNQKLSCRVIFYCINPPTLYLSQKHVDLSPYEPKHQLYSEIQKPKDLEQRQNSFFSREEQAMIHPSQIVGTSLAQLTKLYVKEINYFEKYQILTSKKIGVVVGEVAKVVPFTNFKVYGQKDDKENCRFRVMCLDQWNKVIKITYDEKLLKAPKDSLLMDTDEVDENKKYIGFVSNVNPNGVVVEFCNNIKGIISKNELTLAEIDITQANIGQSFQAYVCKVKKGHIGLTLKSPQMRNSSKKTQKPSSSNNAADQSQQSTSMGTIQSINPKSIHPIYIKLKSNKFAKISIFDGVRAPSLNEVHIIQNLEEHYKVGQQVRVFRKNKQFFLYPPEQMKDPELRYCRVLDVKGSHLRVQTGENEFKNCHITNVTDIVTPYPLSEYKVGQYTIGRVLSQQQICLRLSIVKQGVPKSMQECLKRYSQAEKHGDLRNRLLTIGSSSLKTDMVCFGYVKSCQENGCFVSLSHNYDVRVERCELSDLHIKDREKQFKTNKLVLCRLISSKVKNNQPNVVMFDASLRESVVKYGYPLNDEVLEHGVGLTVEGTVKGYTKGKALVQLHSSKFTGIIGLRDVQGAQQQSLEKSLPIGKTLKFKITQYSFDGSKRLIRLSTLSKIFLKYKQFQTKFQADERVVKLWQNFKQLQSFQPPEEHNELVDVGKLQQNEKDEEERIMNMLALGEMEEEEDEERSEEENRQEERKVMEVEGEGEEIEEEDNEEQDSDQIEEQQMQQQQSQGQQQQQLQEQQNKQRNKQQHEQFRQKTQMFQKMPHPPSFYHSLVLANPTPQSWLMYISSLLNTSTPEQIRAQFLKAIHSFSQIKDKDNMWISWINMELVLGDLMGTVKKAIENNVGMAVYFRVLQILTDRQQWDVAIEFARKMLKKFNTHIKAYIEFLKMVGKYQTANGKKVPEAISQKQILRRASQCLKSHELITIESHIAKHLFESKQYEKGRNVFEELISKHPKRTDLWSMYVDMEVKANEMDKARGLLERELALGLNKKKTKAILKKYYLLEQEHGTEKTAKAILARAQKLAEQFEDENDEAQEENEQ